MHRIHDQGAWIVQAQLECTLVDRATSIVPEKPFTAWPGLSLFPRSGIQEWSEFECACPARNLFVRQLGPSWEVEVGNTGPQLTRLDSRAVDLGSS